MTYVSPTQPYCRCCGRPIRKFVVTHYFGEKHGHDSAWAKYHPDEALTKDEAQRYINQRIVSIRYGYAGNVVAGAWDGESYVDQHFCTGSCASAFGRMAAREYPSLETQKAADARRIRTGR